MKEIRKHQIIPNDWEKREVLREKGQFWTPSWVASAMLTYVIKSSRIVFDPATGKGAFFEALISIETNHNEDFEFYGCDIDEKVFEYGVYNQGNCELEIRDFILNPPSEKFSAIVANPPYIRHHRLSKEIKCKLKEISNSILGFKIDGRAGLHIYFLLNALKLLENGGRLAFIMPADTCEGIFAEDLWKWITKNFCLECVITFAPEATPFPNVDTNALVFLIRKAKPKLHFWWVKSKKSYSDDLTKFIKSNFKVKTYETLNIIKRKTAEALITGLSRNPNNIEFNYKLLDFARVMRGIATGANEFFFLTREQVNRLNIPDEFVRLAIGRTRDVVDSSLTFETYKDLERKNRPTILFAPDGRNINDFPEAVRDYLKIGEEKKINERILIKTRRPWYKMEQREIPVFLFAYLGRRNTRFIKNEARALPLTGFLCVYPLVTEKHFLDKLWKVLNHPRTLENLSLVGKSYGSGALKVEPRGLERLPIPDSIIKEFSLEVPSRNQDKQVGLF